MTGNATNDQQTTPRPRLLENEVCEYLTKRGLLRPSPFAERLSKEQTGAVFARLAKQLGQRYAGCTLDNFRTDGNKHREHVVSTLSTFAYDMPDMIASGGGLLLFGPPGTGKDHLTAALLKLAVGMHHLDAYWIDGGMLFDRIAEAATSDDPAAVRSLQAELVKPHILAISDPQPPKGDLSAVHARRVRDLIDRRYRDCKSTWLTTNIDNKTLAESLLTKPVLDRLRDCSIVLDCNWETNRRKRDAT